MDYDTSDNATTETVRRTDAGLSVKFGLYGNHIIEAEDYRSGLQECDRRFNCVADLFLRYGFKRLTVFGSSNLAERKRQSDQCSWCILTRSNR